MTTVRFIGDVHGKFNQYTNIIKNVDCSRQVGDFGVGFFKWDFHENEKVPYANPPYNTISKANHKFIRGNHDNPDVCKRMDYWLSDGYIERLGEHKVMYVGGALSIDKAFRTEGLDWWSDEELSYIRLQEIIDLYAIEKPDVMVSHDCPDDIALIMEHYSGRKKLDIHSRTRVAFDEMLKIHRPKIWVYGHWHFSFDHVLDGTRFICLNELEFKDLEL
jgi:hypothetical protein